MAVALKKFTPGDPLQLPAALLNELIDMLLERRRGGAGVGAPKSIPRDRDLVKVRNDTGSTLEAFHILGIEAPIFSPSDRLDEFKFNFALTGATPSTASHKGKFLIVQQPAGEGVIVDGLADGVSVVRLNVIDANHRFADVENGDRTQLRTATSGGARILWKEGGTGTKWGLVRLGEEVPKVSRRFAGVLTSDLHSVDGSAAVLTLTAFDDGDVPGSVSAVNSGFAGSAGFTAFVEENWSGGGASPAYVLYQVEHELRQLERIVEYDAANRVLRHKTMDFALMHDSDQSDWENLIIAEITELVESLTFDSSGLHYTTRLAYTFPDSEDGSTTDLFGVYTLPLVSTVFMDGINLMKNYAFVTIINTPVYTGPSIVFEGTVCGAESSTPGPSPGEQQINEQDPPSATTAENFEPPPSPS